ncbi:MAG: hypothetical protein ACPG77_14000 [Nannocystaceae bacterium]
MMVASDIVPGGSPLLGLDIYDVMGLLTMGIFWLNMGLIAFAALARMGPIRSRIASLGDLVGDGHGHTHLREGGRVLLHGHVVAAQSDNALAVHRVEQTGRSAGEGQIFFHDRAYASEVGGGAIEVATESGIVRIELPAIGQQVEVWPRPGAIKPATIPEQTDFTKAQAQARRASGFRRQLITPIVVGDEVWVSGCLAPTEAGERTLELAGPRAEHGDVLVSAVDPKVWAKRCAALCVGFALATLLVSIGCTVAALWPPVYGTISKLGALVGMAILMGNMLFGNLVRDAVRTPIRRIIGGCWQRPNAS